MIAEYIFRPREIFNLLKVKWSDNIILAKHLYYWVVSCHSYLLTASPCFRGLSYPNVCGKQTRYTSFNQWAKFLTADFNQSQLRVWLNLWNEESSLLPFSHPHQLLWINEMSKWKPVASKLAKQPGSNMLFPGRDESSVKLKENKTKVSATSYVEREP